MRAWPRPTEDPPEAYALLIDGAIAAMEFDPQALSAIDDPYPVFDRLREEHPLFHCPERDLWVVSRYQDVRAVLLDAKTFASGRGTVPTGFVSEKPMLITQDAPYHTHLRSAVHLSFTPRRLRALEGFIRETTRALLDAIDSEEEVDLFSALTDPLPVAVITEILGIGFEDRREFSDYAGAIIHAVEGEGPSAEQAMHWIYAYMEKMLPEREARPGEDLVSELLHPAAGVPKLSRDELVGFSSLLLMAGTETTTNGLGNAVALLHEHPELRQQLAQRPELLPGAVEELLRLESPVPGLSRVTTRETEIHGQKLPEGSRVHMAFAAANRDNRIFEHPGEIVPDRHPNPHLAFGLGIHFCLGARLARAEMRIALEELLARFPDYAVIPHRWVRLRSDAARGFSFLPFVGRP